MVTAGVMKHVTHTPESRDIDPGQGTRATQEYASR